MRVGLRVRAILRWRGCCGTPHPLGRGIGVCDSGGQARLPVLRGSRRRRTGSLACPLPTECEAQSLSHQGRGEKNSCRIYRPGQLHPFVRTTSGCFRRSASRCPSLWADCRCSIRARRWSTSILPAARTSEAAPRAHHTIDPFQGLARLLVAHLGSNHRRDALTQTGPDQVVLRFDDGDKRGG